MTMRTLTIDIGGTGLKMIRLDARGEAVGERQRELTPDPRTPKDVLRVLEAMIARQEPFDRVSVGFPGVVAHGVVKTAPNLGTKDWAGFDLGAAITSLTDRPTRVVNDAELQGFGVIEGKGVEMVLTLGTGLGSALYTDGHLVANLELGHHPLRKGKTYEEHVSDAELERIGKKKWRKRVKRVVDTIQPIFNPDRIYVGGGNARKLGDTLPPGVVRFDNVTGMEGGVALWGDRKPKADA